MNLDVERIRLVVPKTFQADVNLVGRLRLDGISAMARHAKTFPAVHAVIPITKHLEAPEFERGDGGGGFDDGGGDETVGQHHFRAGITQEHVRSSVAAARNVRQHAGQAKRPYYRDREIPEKYWLHSIFRLPTSTQLGYLTTDLKRTIPRHRFGQSFQIIAAGNSYGPQRQRGRGHHLDIEQPKATFPQMLHQVIERHLGSIVYSAEH